MLKKPAETEQSAMSKEPAATEQSAMAKGARGNEAAAHSGSAICVSVRADDSFSFRRAEIAVLSIA